MTQFENLFSQISKGHYKPISPDIFDTLEIEGYLEEVDDEDINNFEYLILNIPPQDSMALKEYGDDVLNKYNLFDIELKDNLYPQYIDLIDYDKGIIRIVKHTDSNKYS